jgi:hypothetical protein
MELKDTANLMVSKDFKDRAKAEYYQLDNRIKGLERMLEGYRNNTLDFVPNCSYDLLHTQLVYMKAYRDVLEERAAIENIDLD